MGEETNAYDPAGSQFDDDVTAEQPIGRPSPVRRRKPRNAPPSQSSR